MSHQINNMKALTIKQPFARLILDGEKTLETRTWRTFYTGPLLIVAGQSFHEGECLLGGKDMECLDLIKSYWHNEIPLHQGKAVAVATLTGCYPFLPADEVAACFRWYSGGWVWALENIRPINPFPVRGMPGLFEVEEDWLIFNYLELQPKIF